MDRPPPSPHSRAAAAPPSDTLSGSPYGADGSGLVCGYRFLPGAGAVPLDSMTAAELLDRRAAAGPGTQEDGGFLWLHFSLAHAAAERWLARHAGLPGSFFEMLREGLHSTRIERDDDALIAVINDVRFDFAFEPADLSTLWIGVAPGLVVTARQQPLRAVDRLRIAVNAGACPRSPVELLERLMRAQADVLVGIVRDVTGRIDVVEDGLLVGRRDHQRAKLGAMRRLLVRLQRLLAPEPAALFRLLHQPPAWVADADVQDLRGATEEFSVVLRDMQALQERIKLLQEEVAASVNEDNNRSLFVLTVVTVLALPINILAGLFGMNVGGIPLAEDAHGFWMVVGIVLSFTAVAAWLAFRPKRGDR
jgi:zinc transporter